MRCDLVICSCILPYCWIPTSITIVLDDHFSHSTTEPRVLRKWRDLRKCDLFRVRWRNWNRDISELPNVSVSKRVLLQNLSNDNELDLHGNKRVDERQEYSIWNRDKKQHRNGLFLNHFAMVKQQVKFRKILSAVWYCDTPFNILRNFVRVSLSFVRKFRTKQVVRRICEA